MNARDRLLSFAQRFNPEATLDRQFNPYRDINRCVVKVSDSVCLVLINSGSYEPTQITADVRVNDIHVGGLWGIESDDLLEEFVRRLAKPQEKESEGLPNPEDVPEGEAWLIKFNGKEMEAIKTGHAYYPWSVSDKNFGGYGRDAYANQVVTLISRLVPEVPNV